MDSPAPIGARVHPGEVRRPGGIVLAGGRSTRMGTSKAWMPFGPETMLQRIVRLLGAVVDPIVVVAAAGQELPPLPSGVRIARDERDGRGPLEGLRAGLKALPVESDAAYVTGCDVPLLVPDFVRQLLRLAAGYDAAVMEVDGVTHPLPAVYRPSILLRIEELLSADRLRTLLLLEAVRARRVTTSEMTADPELRTLRNLNTREDYARALADAGLDDGQRSRLIRPNVRS